MSFSTTEKAASSDDYNAREELASDARGKGDKTRGLARKKRVKKSNALE